MVKSERYFPDYLSEIKKNEKKIKKIDKIESIEKDFLMACDKGESEKMNQFFDQMTKLYDVNLSEEDKKQIDILKEKYSAKGSDRLGVFLKLERYMISMTRKIK